MADQPTGATPPQPPQPPKPPAAPAPIKSIDDLLERAEDRLIPKGSTVRVSPDNAELKSPAALREAQDTLEACGVKLVQDPAVAATEIRIEPPAPKK
jgi:hypothetical protein